MKIVIVVALIAVALSTSESCQLCPAFWVPFQSNCYRIFGFKLTWSQAEERCNTYINGFAMGHLVSIRSEDENRFVSKLWNSATGGMVAVADYTYWIELTDSETEGTWLWSDDGPVDYTNWHGNQPDNHSGNEDCVHLWNRDTANVTWNDASCSLKLFYACELPQNSRGGARIFPTRGLHSPTRGLCERSEHHKAGGQGAAKGPRRGSRGRSPRKQRVLASF